MGYLAEFAIFCLGVLSFCGCVVIVSGLEISCCFVMLVWLCYHRLFFVGYLKLLRLFCEAVVLLVWAIDWFDTIVVIMIFSFIFCIVGYYLYVYEIMRVAVLVLLELWVFV